MKLDQSESIPSGGIAFINAEKFLQFNHPDHATADEEGLTADIVSLDHRAHEVLGPDTPEWKEVLGILVNAANFVTWHQVPAAHQLYTRAEQAFFRHIQEKNRVKYLVGLMLGVMASTLVAGLLYTIARSLAQPFVSPSLLPLLCLFAGIGSLTSVLTRLDQIDLKVETRTELVMLSGAARPVVAIFFAIIVYLILNLKLIDIKIGSPTNDNQNYVYLITSFLCGFGERFAQDILSKVAPGIAG